MSKNRTAQKNAGSLPAEIADDDTSFDKEELDALADAESEDDGPPDGFDINAELTRADGWAVKGEGLIILGRLINRQEFRGGDGKMRAFYSVLLQRKCRAVIGQGDEAAEGWLEKGQTVNVDDSAALGMLESRSKDGGTYDVWIRYGEKEKLKGKAGQTFWPAEVKLRMVKPPQRLD
jgi:hypothetical protein